MLCYGTELFFTPSILQKYNTFVDNKKLMTIVMVMVMLVTVVVIAMIIMTTMMITVMMTEKGEIIL